MMDLLLASAGGSQGLSLIAIISIFVLAVFVGLEVIAKVPQTLHTPLMSATNAIHGVIVVGAIVVLGSAQTPLMIGIGILAMIFAVLNVVGGFVVTDRMLEMFKPRAKAGGDKK